jgi:uncharacterized protein YbaA (DUF1428 family)
MKTTTAILLLSMIATAGPLAAADPDSRCFEMRTYYAAPGKLDALNARFRDHTCKLFEKHGMENLGYWMPVDNPDAKLIYILAYPSREAREASWKAFMADPDWQKASKASETDGKLVTKAESVFLKATDYSPSIKPSKAGEVRTFELRVYTAAPGKLDALNARFRNHTVKLFAKHGMTQMGYWTPLPGEKASDTKLYYILAHPSKEAADAAFKAFRADPDWIAAKAASEQDGSLTAAGGVSSTFMIATDYSPTK